MIPIQPDAAIGKLAVDPVDPQAVYAATFNKGLLKTIDGGSHWESSATDSRRQAVCLHCDPSQGCEACCLPAGCKEGLYQSSDGGQSWGQVSSGLNPEAKIREILIDQNDPARMYLADKNSGVYVSEDGGQTWLQLPGWHEQQGGQRPGAVQRRPAPVCCHGRRRGVPLGPQRPAAGDRRDSTHPNPGTNQDRRTSNCNFASKGRSAATATALVNPAGKTAGKTTGGCPSSFLPLALILGMRIMEEKKVQTVILTEQKWIMLGKHIKAVSPPIS